MTTDLAFIGHIGTETVAAAALAGRIYVFAFTFGTGLLAPELSPKVGDGGNRKGGISWGCLTPPLLHRRSDMPYPRITSSS
nr:hypothetical protein [Bradyrhizobium murdochi]